METLTLQHCCMMQTGIPISRSDFAESGDIQVVQLKDVDSEGRLRSPLERVARRLRNDKLIQNNDVLLKGRGMNMIATHIEHAPENTIASSAYFILRPRDNVLPAYLAWYLNNTRLPITQSATIPLLQLSNLKEMHVHLPEHKVQQQIIATHKLIGEARGLTDQYYKKIGQLLKGVALNAGSSKQESL